MARIAAVILCVLGISSTSFAKGDKSSWANLSSLQAGEMVQVVESNSRKVSGTFVNYSDISLTLNESSGSQTIQKQDVRSVKLVKRSHRLRNTLLFGAVGAGAGAGIGAAAYKSCTAFCIGSFNRGESAGIGAVLGFVGGVVVGALWPSHKTIYEAPSH